MDTLEEYISNLGQNSPVHFSSQLKKLEDNSSKLGIKIFVDKENLIQGKRVIDLRNDPQVEGSRTIFLTRDYSIATTFDIVPYNILEDGTEEKNELSHQFLLSFYTDSLFPGRVYCRHDGWGHNDPPSVVISGNYFHLGTELSGELFHGEQVDRLIDFYRKQGLGRNLLLEIKIRVAWQRSNPEGIYRVDPQLL
ncbi:MAG: hypothetical protein Q8Q01_02285 [archaeon]|nr:hypothetical protein [archaeon]